MTHSLPFQRADFASYVCNFSFLMYIFNPNSIHQGNPKHVVDMMNTKTRFQIWRKFTTLRLTAASDVCAELNKNHCSIAAAKYMYMYITQQF